MTTDLFPDMEESLSPLAKWKRDNFVRIFESEGTEIIYGPIKASAHGLKAFGKDADDACWRLAQICWAQKSIPYPKN
tara:strand:+ start:355 stop:585 length:231 start_codon:yes stop_codon:yes gene_type:complete